jgi:hypothetical protein
MIPFTIYDPIYHLHLISEYEFNNQLHHLLINDDELTQPNQVLLMPSIGTRLWTARGRE